MSPRRSSSSNNVGGSPTMQRSTFSDSSVALVDGRLRADVPVGRTFVWAVVFALIISGAAPLTTLSLLTDGPLLESSSNETDAGRSAEDPGSSSTSGTTCTGRTADNDERRP